MPRVEVCSEHHQLGLERRVGTRDLADDVEAVQVLCIPANLELPLDSHWNLLLQHPIDAAIVLGREGEHRNRCRRIRRTIALATGEDRSQIAVVAGYELTQRAFL